MYDLIYTKNVKQPRGGLDSIKHNSCILYDVDMKLCQKTFKSCTFSTASKTQNCWYVPNLPFFLDAFTYMY